MNGKGDKRRPMKVSSKEYSDNWDRIFNKTRRIFHSLSKRLKINLRDVKQRSECCILEGNKKSVEIGGRKVL